MKKGLDLLFQSTTFWTAVFSVLFGVAAFWVTKNEVVTGFAFGSFWGRIAYKTVRPRIGGTNPPPEKDEK